jgi:hypothetical protein
LIGAFLEEDRYPNYFSSASSAKSHVKPQKQLTHCSASTYEWHFSYTQSRKIEQEEKKPRRKVGAFAFKPREKKGKINRMGSKNHP